MSLAGQGETTDINCVDLLLCQLLVLHTMCDQIG